MGKLYDSQMWKKLFTRDNLCILILLGLLLVVISIPTKKKNEGDSNPKEGMGSITYEGVSNIPSTGVIADSGYELTHDALNEEDQTYCTYLEEKLKKVLGKMDGVGEVEVMVTLSSSRELILEQEESINKTTTKEKDSEGGERSILQSQEQVKTVFFEQSNRKEPYIVKTIMPKVEGVVVVAQGAGKGQISMEIIKMVEALFDIEAHKIKVVKMNK